MISADNRTHSHEEVFQLVDVATGPRAHHTVSLLLYGSSVGITVLTVLPLGNGRWLRIVHRES